MLVLQSAVTQLKEVRDDKVENRSGITQEDASKIAAAEAILHDGQVPANSVSSKAQVGFSLGLKLDCVFRLQIRRSLQPGFDL